MKSNKAKSREFYRAKDIMEILDISQASAYKEIKELNQELNKMGYRTIRGKVSKDFFEDRYYYKSKKKVSQ